MKELYEKYKAKNYQDLPAINPLSFILRKAELGHNLTYSEWQWLEQHQQIETKEIIKNLEQYKHSLYQEIHQEISELWKNPFLHKFILKLELYEGIESGTAFSFYKVNAQERLLNSELSFAMRQEYHQHLDKIEFFNKKQKYGITENITLDEKLKSIFDKLEEQRPLSSGDIEWIMFNQADSFLIPLKNQFLQLQHKYNAVVSDDFKGNQLKLFYILQKIDQSFLPNETEIAFLKENSLFGTLEIVQKMEFSALKKKYQATQIEDDDIKHHLFKVLKKLDADSLLPEADINYLKKRKLFETVKFFYKKEADKLFEKIQQGLNLTAQDIEWCGTHQYEEIIFTWLKTIYKVKYNLLDSPLFVILKKLHAGQRLTDEEVIWLDTEELLKPSSKIYITHHALEAQFYEKEFKRTKGYWSLVNASAAWRKAEKPQQALKQTNDLDFKKIKPPKLTSALLTTRGGALRDVGHLDKAEKCALEAISYFPDSHNPYTLMGALCYDTGRYSEGDRWFYEAIKRGAKPQDQDAEIKRILLKKKDKEREELANHLLEKDRYRFNWVKQYLK